MNLSGFCRNCLAKWYLAAADGKELDLSFEDVREWLYDMPYSDWKAKFQKPL